VYAFSSASITSWCRPHMRIKLSKPWLGSALLSVISSAAGSRALDMANLTNHGAAVDKGRRAPGKSTTISRVGEQALNGRKGWPYRIAGAPHGEICPELMF